MSWSKVKVMHLDCSLCPCIIFVMAGRIDVSRVKCKQRNQGHLPRSSLQMIQRFCTSFFCKEMLLFPKNDKICYFIFFSRS